MKKHDDQKCGGKFGVSYDAADESSWSRMVKYNTAIPRAGQRRLLSPTSTYHASITSTTSSFINFLILTQDASGGLLGEYINVICPAPPVDLIICVQPRSEAHFLINLQCGRMSNMPKESHHHKSVSGGSSQDFHASIPPQTRQDTIHLTPYSRPPIYDPSSYGQQRQYQSWSGEDPRSSSTQSLLPENLPGDGRRTLLLVYIHGFMGDDTSFQKFPAHVHNLLTIALCETHVIHSKIYPRYKSRKAIEFARDDFSHWLALPCPGYMNIC